MRLRALISIGVGTEGQQYGRARGLCAIELAHAIYATVDTGFHCKLYLISLRYLQSVLRHLNEVSFT